MRNGTDGTIIKPDVMEPDNGVVAIYAIVLVSLVMILLALVSTYTLSENSTSF